MWEVIKKTGEGVNYFKTIAKAKTPATETEPEKEEDVTLILIFKPNTNTFTLVNGDVIFPTTNIMQYQGLEWEETTREDVVPVGYKIKLGNPIPAGRTQIGEDQYKINRMFEAEIFEGEELAVDKLMVKINDNGTILEFAPIPGTEVTEEETAEIKAKIEKYNTWVEAVIFM